MITDILLADLAIYFTLTGGYFTLIKTLSWAKKLDSLDLAEKKIRELITQAKTKISRIFNFSTYTFETDPSFPLDVERKLEAILPEKDMEKLRKLWQGAISADFIQFYKVNQVSNVGIAIINTDDSMKDLISGVLNDVVRTYLSKYNLQLDIISQWRVWTPYGVPYLEVAYGSNDEEVEHLRKIMGDSHSLALDNLRDDEEEYDLF